jgi:hypothetical protein
LPVNDGVELIGGAVPAGILALDPLIAAAMLFHARIVGVADPGAFGDLSALPRLTPVLAPVVAALLAAVFTTLLTTVLAPLPALLTLRCLRLEIRLLLLLLTRLAALKTLLLARLAPLLAADLGIDRHFLGHGSARKRRGGEQAEDQKLPHLRNSSRAALAKQPRNEGVVHGGG